MSHKGELEFKDLKELNEMLKNKEKSVESRGRKSQSSQSSETLGQEMSASQSGLSSQADEDKRRRSKKEQQGGDFGATPLPWQWYGTDVQLNTQALNANNYGRLSAQGVGSPTAGYGYTAQMGGNFPSLWGTNEPTFNQLEEPNFNTLYGNLSDPQFYANNLKGGCGCDQEGGAGEKYTREHIAEAVSDVTGDPKESVHETLTTLYGPKRQQFGDKELAEVTGVHSDEKGKEMFPREAVVEAVAQTTGEPQHVVNKTIEEVYGPKKQFTEGELADAVTIQMDEKDKRRKQRGGGGGKNKKYNASQAKKKLSEKSGLSESEISFLDQSKQYTEKDLDLIAKELKEVSGKQKGRRSGQRGGDATPMPWEWYNPSIPKDSQMINYNISAPELPQLIFPTSGPSGNSPYLIGGGSKEIAEAIDKNAPLNKTFGTKELVITPENKDALFAYLYEMYPKLKDSDKTKNIFQQAEDDDAYIWSEVQNFGMKDVINYIIDHTITFYQDKYSDDKEGLKRLTEILHSS